MARVTQALHVHLDPRKMRELVLHLDLVVSWDPEERLLGPEERFQ